VRYEIRIYSQKIVTGVIEAASEDEAYEKAENADFLSVDDVSEDIEEIDVIEMEEK
jgi:hypothetical protein